MGESQGLRPRPGAGSCRARWTGGRGYQAGVHSTLCSLRKAQAPAQRDQGGGAWWEPTRGLCAPSILSLPTPLPSCPPRGRMARTPPPWGSLYWQVCWGDARYAEGGGKPPDVLIQSVRYHLACSGPRESPMSPHTALPGPRSRPTSPEIGSGSHCSCHVAATCVAWPVAGYITLPQLQSRPDEPAPQLGNRGSDRV